MLSIGELEVLLDLKFYKFFFQRFFQKFKLAVKNEKLHKISFLAMLNLKISILKIKINIDLKNPPF